MKVYMATPAPGQSPAQFTITCHSWDGDFHGVFIGDLTNMSWDRIQRCHSEVIRRAEWQLSIQVWKNLSEIRQNCGIQDRRLWGLLDFTTYTHTHTYVYIYIQYTSTKTKDGIQFKQHKYAIQHSTMILEFDQWCEISHPNKYTGLSKQVDRDILSCQTVCDWNGVHQIKTRTLVTFQKWVIQSIQICQWIGRGITTLLMWELGVPTDNGSPPIHCYRLGQRWQSVGSSQVLAASMQRLWVSQMLHAVFHHGFPLLFHWCFYVFTGFPHGFPWGKAMEKPWFFSTFSHGSPTWSSASSPSATSSPPVIRRQDRMINMLPARLAPPQGGAPVRWLS